MEICFSFDTTGSMYRCIKQVKQNVQNLIQRLQKDIPGIRIAVYAHGDYYDHRNYVTKHIDFSTNAEELCEWVKNVGKTGGGDSDECYELVLQEVQKLSWTPGSQRALVMIGDSNPHGSIYGFHGEIHRISWQDEVNNLKNMKYEDEVRARDVKIKKDLDLLFGTLKSEATVPSAPEKDPKTRQTLDPKNTKKIVKRTKKIAKEKKAHSKRSTKGSKEKDTAHNPKVKKSSRLRTKWQVVMIAYVSTEQAQSLLWIRRGRGNVGNRRKVIFDGKYEQPSLYEFSVKNVQNGKHRIVFCKSSKGFILNEGSWETKLLTGSIKKEINKILGTHRRIFARRRAIKK